jgi:hypothetical protein
MMNYRPVSLLTIFSKILVMLNRLNQHLWVNNVLMPELVGFRKASTIENAGVTINNILTGLNE